MREALRGKGIGLVLARSLRGIHDETHSWRWAIHSCKRGKSWVPGVLVAWVIWRGLELLSPDLSLDSRSSRVVLCHDM